MTVFAEYHFYKTEYNTTETALFEQPYLFYAKKATMIIDNFTGGNVDKSNPPEAVKMCCCELAEYLNSFESSSATKNIKNGISSESVGGWSVSYGTNYSEYTAQSKEEIESIISLWLSNTGLLSLSIQRGKLRC